MSLSLDDVQRIARLARIELNAGEADRTHTQLNGIFDLIEQLKAVDTSGIEPLAHPLGVVQPMAQRLRDDVVTEKNNREANMANAPAREDGLFLVPKVIE